MSAHKLIKFTQSLYSKPHLINQVAFNAVSSYLTQRNMMNPSQLVSEEPEEEVPDDLDDFDPNSGIGVITIEGALSYKPVYGLCGEVGCSYTSLLDQAEDMIEAGAKTIVLNIDSGGGEGYGCMETADELRKMCDEAGVYLIAYNDGCIASAAYAIACAADEVISNPSADTGSIGVLIALINDSKALEQEGYARSFIYAGSKKIPYSEDGAWKESFLEDLQSKVDTLYGEFVSHVNKYTGIETNIIRGFEAGMFSAQEALSNGLINKVMTRSEFVGYLVKRMEQGDD
jgi:ClpP class serine protease